MSKKKPVKSKSLDITLYPEKWRKLLSEFVGRADKKQTLREWCKEQDLPEAYTYKWITKEAVKLEEKAQQKRVKLDGDLPIRQAVFVEEYLTDFNGTKAAKKAGYSEKTAGQLGHQLLQNPSYGSCVKIGRMCAASLRQATLFFLDVHPTFRGWNNQRKRFWLCLNSSSYYYIYIGLRFWVCFSFKSAT